MTTMGWTKRDAAELLERMAIGDEKGLGRERTLQRLMAHRDEPYPDAVVIATDSLIMATRQVVLVHEAARLLGIQL